MTVMPDPLQYAVDALYRGKPILLLDDPDREGEGDFVLAAEHAVGHPDRLRHHLRFGAEFCVAMPITHIERLLALPQHPYYGKKDPCNSYERVDARTAHSGISAADRALAIEALLYDRVPISHPSSRLNTHGHTTPLGARPGGVLVRPGHTEGSLDLVLLADLHPAAVISEVKDLETGDPMKGDRLLSFARDLDLLVVPMQGLIAYKRSVL